MPSLTKENILSASKQSIATAETDPGPTMSSLLPATANIGRERAVSTVQSTKFSTTTASTNDNSNQIPNAEPWMKTVVICSDSQQEIFPIIESLSNDPYFKDNTFVKQWKIYKKNARKPMCSTITWRNLKSLLNIHDLNQYRIYLQKCPNVAKFIRMHSSKNTQSGFDYGIIPQTSPTDASYELVFPSDTTPTQTKSEQLTETTELAQLTEVAEVTHNASVQHVSVNDSNDFQVLHTASLRLCMRGDIHLSNGISSILKSGVMPLSPV